MFNLYSGKYKHYLLVPAVLFIVFLFLITVFPGIPKGIDLEGGTLIILRSDKPIDAGKTEALLKQKFELVELQVTSISAPNSYGLAIQFAENKPLAKAENELRQARILLEKSPLEARKHSDAARAELEKFTTLASTQRIDEEVTVLQEALIDAKEKSHKQLQDLIQEEFSLGKEMKYQKREIGPTLGQSFWQSALIVAAAALILVILVIFVFFREVIPSLAVIGAAVFDIAGALALMAIFRVPLSLSTIPALLMLIGYSVDTDIMLTTRLLKRRERDVRERAHESMITGLTMTCTTLAALSAMLVLSYYGQVLVIYEIASVLFFGLLADLISTWLMNAPILLWYAEKKEGSLK